MKAFLVILIASFLVLSLVGCTQPPEEPLAQPSGTGQATPIAPDLPSDGLEELDDLITGAGEDLDGLDQFDQDPDAFNESDFT
ncbi:hypothetical protein KKE06_02590 [Candidatus Micrarchaeota archaeon]|nr:hypothetical protein [Candidatus Micrarchaeota archaeon]MBU1930013.1 hypothetical protein [Candidatus Micrarchaeota archaeon]